MSEYDSEYEIESLFEEEELKYSDIIGYEHYIIYENGRVFNKKTGRYLRPILDSHGYLYVALCKNGKVKKHRIHRLIAMYFIPNPVNKQCVDHINGIITDNRIKNLRWATKIENGQNSKTHKNNTSGSKNVYWSKKAKKWKVAFKINGKSKHFGYFDNYQDAYEFAKNKRSELYGEYANHD